MELSYLLSLSTILTSAVAVKTKQVNFQQVKQTLVYFEELIFNDLKKAKRQNLSAIKKMVTDLIIIRERGSVTFCQRLIQQTSKQTCCPSSFKTTKT